MSLGISAYLKTIFHVINKIYFFTAPTQHAQESNRKTASFLPCKKCFGWGKMVTPDPRCRYGCDKNMTYPATRPTPTTQFNTEPIVTSEPFTEPSEQPEQLEEQEEPEGEPFEKVKEDEENGSAPNCHVVNPMMKLVPRVGDDFLPLLTQQQMAEYEEVVELIRFLKQRKSFKSSNNDERKSLKESYGSDVVAAASCTNIWFVVAVCSLCFIVVLLTATLLMYFYVVRPKLSRKVAPFTLPEYTTTQTTCNI